MRLRVIVVSPIEVIWISEIIRGGLTSDRSSQGYPAFIAVPWLKGRPAWFVVVGFVRSFSGGRDGRARGLSFSCLPDRLGAGLSVTQLVHAVVDVGSKQTLSLPGNQIGREPLMSVEPLPGSGSSSEVFIGAVGRGRVGTTIFDGHVLHLIQDGRSRSGSRVDPGQGWRSMRRGRGARGRG